MISHLFAHNLNIKNIYLTIHRSLSGPNSQDQCGSGSNDNELVSHIPLSSRTEASQSDGLLPYPGHSFTGGGRVLLL